MPKSKQATSTGERLLDAVKEAEARGLVARTADAVERLQGSSSVKSERAETDHQANQGLPRAFSSSEELWTRHDFGSGNLLVFSHGEKVLIIKKSPESDKWFVDYEPAEDWLL